MRQRNLNRRQAEDRRHVPFQVMDPEERDFEPHRERFGGRETHAQRPDEARAIRHRDGTNVRRRDPGFG